MLVYGYDAQIIEWTSIKFGGLHFDNAKAIGIVENGELIAGIVYNNYTESPAGEPISIEMSLYSISPRWATKGNLRGIFGYPFLQLGVRRLQVSTHRKARKVRNQIRRLGFVFEGYAREAHPRGGDSAFYSMLKSECRWIK